MPDSPTKINRGSLSPLDTKQSRESTLIQESPIKTIMQLRPCLDFSKISIARTISATANMFIQQKKSNQDEPRTQPEILKLDTLKAPTTPSPGLISNSPTIDMDITSPIVLEESKTLALPSNLKEGKNIIGDYKIGKMLGKGAYGAVKFGEHRYTGQKVAIKIIDKRFQKTEKAQLRIRREIEILKKVKHPNLMECYGTYETEKSYFLITEYCSGGELFDYVQKRDNLSENEAVEFFSQLLSGVEYLHKLGICHRDLKLENILLDDQNNVKIADFGLSMYYEPGDTLKTRCGSPHYMAPEILQGEKYDPAASDIWSCGVVFFGMINGFMPFDGENDAELFANIKKGEYEMDEELDYSDDCYNFISGLMDSNVETRFTLPEIREHILMRGPKKEVEIIIEEL